MIVRQLDIEEFRGIGKCKEPLELSKFTVLVGRNNSGKSAVLEALSLFPLPERSGFPHPIYGGGQIDLLKRLHGGLSSLVYGYHGTSKIEYTINGDSDWRIEIDEKGKSNIFKDDKSLTRSDISGVFGVDGEKLRRTILFIPNDTELFGDMIKKLESESRRSQIMKLGANETLTRELLNEYVDDKYTEILMDSPELRLRKELPDGKRFYIKPRDLGDGLKKVMLVTLWLEALRPDVVLWDDFEGSAHLSLIEGLLTWLDKKDWQVILSTHSADVLSHLVDVRPKDVSVVLLKKGSDDLLVHHRHSLEEIEDTLYANQDPRLLADRLEL